MNKNLTVNGNSWIIYINKLFTEMLGINPDERRVELNIKKNILYITKASNIHAKKNFIHKQLIKRGGGYGLVLSKPILGLLNINPEKDSVEISVEENTIIVKKAN